MILYALPMTVSSLGVGVSAAMAEAAATTVVRIAKIPSIFSER